MCRVQPEWGADRPFQQHHAGMESVASIPQNLQKALLHHAIETNLFEAAGYTAQAATARVRRGSIARALPPETAVRIAREVATWRPTGP